MTVIVGLASKGKVYIGGDSAGVGGWDLTIRSDSKVFKIGKFVMGFTSSFRMGQLLRYNLTPPDHMPATDLHRYMATDFVNAVRKCLSEGGYAKKDKEQEEGGTFLVGYRGRLFSVHDDYQVGESADSFDAVGCGNSIALGSLYSTAKLSPKERLLTALHASERYSIGVRGPFVVLDS